MPNASQLAILSMLSKFLKKILNDASYRLGMLTLKQIKHGISHFSNLGIPKPHLILLGAATTIFITTAFSLVLDKNTNHTLIQNDKALHITLPSKNLEQSEEDNPETIEPTPKKIHYLIKSGDSLALIGNKLGVSPNDIHLLSVSKPYGKLLKKIRPGEKLTFMLGQDEILTKLIYQPQPLKLFSFDKKHTYFTSSLTNISPNRDVTFNHGIIEQSLFLSSQKAGLPDALTMRIAQIFQWDIDFVLDIRPGDSFFVMYEELFIDNQFIGHGEILAAEFINRNKSYIAILFEDKNGSKDFYNLDGESMRKAFLRAPVEFSRISSSFNLRRKHPLHKTVRAHRGIDYAAPNGTPIIAAGDGRVTKASRTRANGRYVVIQHGQQFVTKYLHLSNFGTGIKAGRNVKQGQIIGYVGQTGYATGPHLHYEFLVNGVHKNPRTVQLPKAMPIKKENRRNFKEFSSKISMLLKNYKGQIHLAIAG